MMVYDTTLNNLFIWTGSAWESVPASGDAGANGSVQYNDNGIIAGAANLQYDKAGGFTSLRSGSALRAYVADNSVYSTISDLGAGGGLTINNLNADGISLKIGSVNTNVLGAGTANWYDGAGVSQMAFVGSDKSLTLGADLKIWRGPGSGADNVGIGRGTFNTLSTGASNVGVGLESCNKLTTGNDNACLGNQTGYRITTASGSVAVGAYSLSGASGVTGEYNVAIGLQAMYTGGSPLSGIRNIGIGLNAGRNITTGSYNVFAGSGSGYSAANITGNDNIGLGRETFGNLSSGTANVAIGYTSLNAITTGIGNTCVGQSTGNKLAVSNYTVAIGYQALSNYTGDDSVAIGTNALASNTTGIQNVAVGRNALFATTTENYCTAVGNEAAAVNTADSVTAIGRRALYTNTIGANNTACGMNALFSNVSGTENTAVGYTALSSVNANYNTAVGSSALTIASGQRNTALGAYAGAVQTAGNSNIFLGINSRGPNLNDSNQLCIGSVAEWVGTDGAANTYFAAAGASLGYWRVVINGTTRKIQVYADV